MFQYLLQGALEGITLNPSALPPEGQNPTALGTPDLDLDYDNKSLGAECPPIGANHLPLAPLLCPPVREADLQRAPYAALRLNSDARYT